jgi:hypothetical protein
MFSRTGCASSKPPASSNGSPALSVRAWYTPWGVSYLTDPAADGGDHHEFDLHYVEGIDALHDAEFGLVVDEQPTRLRFSRGHLDQAAGEPAHPILTVHTSSAFMNRWAAGAASWDDGRASGEVILDGPSRNWDTWLAATGYLLAYDPEPNPEPDHA